MSLAENIPDDIREDGKAHEIKFWQDFCRSDRFRDNFCKATPNPEMDVDVEMFIKGAVGVWNGLGRAASILDIGAGPVSMLSRSFSGQKVNLIAADPLGDDYRAMWHNSDPILVQPVSCDGEKISSIFEHQQFDITHVRNALDHVIHPIEVLDQMIHVTRHDGFIIVHGFENEADAENWEGFHQWNLHTNGTDLVITGKRNVHYSVAAHFRDKINPIRAYRRDLPNGKGWCGFIAQAR